jgi:1-acyl-sn-glycerol-3-phosphate acyltransferase
MNPNETKVFWSFFSKKDYFPSARLFGRAAGFAAYFYLVTFLSCLAGVAVRIFARHQASRLAKTWARLVLAGMGPIGGIRLVVTGLEHLPEQGAALLASQHQSEFDTLIWLVLLTHPSYVMKQELTKIPLFGPLLVPAGMIPVDREAGAKALRRLLTETRAAIHAGRQIVIFPEGTRVPPGQTLPLQPGIAAIAARSNLPVFPVATDSGHCWARHPLARRPGTIHVAIGPPIQAGTSRADMLLHIEAFWRQQETNGFLPVDKLVEQNRQFTQALPLQATKSLGNQEN